MSAGGDFSNFFKRHFLGFPVTLTLRQGKKLTEGRGGVGDVQPFPRSSCNGDLHFATGVKDAGYSQSLLSRGALAWPQSEVIGSVTLLDSLLASFLLTASVLHLAQPELLLLCARLSFRKRHRSEVVPHRRRVRSKTRPRPQSVHSVRYSAKKAAARLEPNNGFQSAPSGYAKRSQTP